MNRWVTVLLALVLSACAQAGISSCPRPPPVVAHAPSSPAARLAAEYRQCLGGHPRACARIATGFEQGPLRVRDHRALRRLFAELCGTRFPFDPEGCFAAALHARACRAGVAESCRALAGLLVSGRLGEPRPREARAALSRGCAQGHDDSCAALMAGLAADGFDDAELGAVVRALESGCKRGTAAACHQLGTVRQRGLVGPPNLEQARQLYERACSLGYGAACMAQGTMQRRGLGGSSDATAALESFTLACRAGIAGACLELGRAVEHGRGTRADPAAAFDHYRRARLLSQPACDDRGDAEACFVFATLLREGSGGEPSASDAEAHLERGCRAGSAAACGAWLVHDGTIDQAHLPIARAALQRACDLGDGEGCFWLGRIGDGANARRAFERGCRAGHGSACNAAGLSPFPPREAGKESLKRACALGDAPGCHHLAVALELPPDSDALAALSLNRRACVWGLGSACLRLGSALSSGESVAVDMIGATRAYREGCDLGLADACFEAGVLRQEGVRVTPNPEVGRALLTRACRNGAQRACTRIALRRIRGLEGERDVATALSELDASCSAGHGQACYELGDLYRRGRDVGQNMIRAKRLFSLAATASVKPCEATLALCYPRRDAPADFPRHWVRWQAAPSLALVAEPACDQRLERVCNDATDALTASCELGDPTCFSAAELTRRLANRGLGSGAARADELERLGCKQRPERCPKR